MLSQQLQHGFRRRFRLQIGHFGALEEEYSRRYDIDALQVAGDQSPILMWHMRVSILT